MKQKTILSLVEQPIHKSIKTCVPISIKVSVDDPKNCFAQSWDDGWSNTSKRCPGLSTFNNGRMLVCTFFKPDESTVVNGRILSSEVLYTPEGKSAQWGEGAVVRRCSSCIAGEQRMNKD